LAIIDLQQARSILSNAQLLIDSTARSPAFKQQHPAAPRKLSASERAQRRALDSGSRRQCASEPGCVAVRARFGQRGGRQDGGRRDVKRLQSRIGELEKALVEYKLYVAKRYASKEFLAKTKREILDSIRDLGRRIDQHS
jgi:hypothetical protein